LTLTLNRPSTKMTENAFYPLPTILCPFHPTTPGVLFPHDFDPLLGNLSPESTIAASSAISALLKNEKEAHEIFV